ncbi:MAG: hypothetical protein CRN43_08655 [Candidatus Nephrothrix sp. EaCA]|nr:MAG: hypothetical protein CRN43_08655 [Candidatus Nephrothrix sp. EaCA]
MVQYKNGQLYSRNNNGAFVYSDDVLKDGGNVLPVRFRYKKDDVARIDLLSISEAAYKFYNDLNNIQRNDGGMFNAPAANPVSNVSNGALGFFQASDDSYKEITIKP